MEEFKKKLVTLKFLKKKFLKFPRKKKIALCHGVFDIVHPGHLRHLIYTKKKAEFLIVSITKDIFIKKGKYRPHVPQEIRAVNLCYYTMVDYVIIDDYETPINLLKDLQPDFFSKGYEYSDLSFIKGETKTSEESDIIKKYGGQIIFTPGDIVYSSTEILSKKKPLLSHEKLNLIFENEKIGFKEIFQALKGFKEKKVHIIGDTIIDSLSRCSMLGGQSKTPTMSILFENRENFIGGAAIVAKHLSAAGAKVTFTTIMGNDDLMKYAKKDLKDIKLNLIIDNKRPTTNKNSFVVDNYRLIKVDTLDNSPFNDEIMKKIHTLIKSTHSDLVIFSDFRHGIFNSTSIPFLIEAIPKNVIKVADSQVASRWGNILDFKSFDIITPNEKEARFALGDQDSNIGLLANTLEKKAKSTLLILKLGDKGVLFTNEHKKDQYYFIDSFVNNLVDAVGAGDALLAYSSLSYAVNKNNAISAVLGSIAASCECEKDGNIPVYPGDIKNKIEEYKNILNKKY